MGNFDQSKAPYVDALRAYAKQDIVPFDVPGHHMGNIHNPAVDLLGREIYRLDVNAPIGLDNLSHPHGVVKEAEAYFAEATGADHAFFLINGTLRPAGRERESSSRGISINRLSMRSSSQAPSPFTSCPKSMTIWKSPISPRWNNIGRRFWRTLPQKRSL